MDTCIPIWNLAGKYKSGHPESSQGPSDRCTSLQSDALPTELCPVDIYFFTFKTKLSQYIIYMRDGKPKHDSKKHLRIGDRKHGESNHRDLTKHRKTQHPCTLDAFDRV